MPKNRQNFRERQALLAELQPDRDGEARTEASPERGAGMESVPLTGSQRKRVQVRGQSRGSKIGNATQARNKIYRTWQRQTPLKRSRAILTRGRRNKYGVSRDPLSRTYNGEEYHSRLEARYAEALDLRMKAVGPYQIKSWRRQVPIKLIVNGMLVSTYIMDFVVTHMDGREEWVEVKGFDTDVWKIKFKLLKALFPDQKVTVQRATP